METINMQCKVSLKYIMLKVVCLVEHTYVCRRSIDRNLVEMYTEMKELLDKQVYICTK